MPHGQRVVVDERSSGGDQNGTGDVGAVDRIGAVKHDEAQLVITRRLHRTAHRGGVREESGAHVLHVEDQRIDPRQAIGARGERISVQAVDG
jgi:hypothetical protein